MLGHEFVTVNQKLLDYCCAKTRMFCAYIHSFYLGCGRRERAAIIYSSEEAGKINCVPFFLFCFVSAVIAHFSFLSTFTWLNVMSIATWWDLWYFPHLLISLLFQTNQLAFNYSCSGYILRRPLETSHHLFSTVGNTGAARQDSPVLT